MHLLMSIRTVDSSTVKRLRIVAGLVIVCSLVPMYSHVIRPSKLPILLENPESPKYNWDGKNPDLTFVLIF